MKRILLSCYWLLCLMSNLYPQNIYQSKDVKLKAPLKTQWEYKVNDIIVNQHITGDVCYLNTVNGISAISLLDGKSIWNYSFPAFPLLNSVATFNDKYAVFTSYNFNDSTEVGTSKLTLVDLSNGKEVWSLVSNERFYKPTPFITENFVFCLSGSPNKWRVKEKYSQVGLDEAELVAHSVTDGKEVWKTSLSDEESEMIYADKQYVFIKHDFDVSGSGIPKNKITVFAATNGKKLWKYDPSGMITKSSVDRILIEGDKVYTTPIPGKAGVVAQLNLTDGEEKWTLGTSASDNIYRQDNKLIYYGANSWMLIDVLKGERIIGKRFTSPSIFGAILGQAFGNTVFGKIAATISGYSNLFSKLFGSDDSAPIVIPTRAMYSDLLNSSAVNEHGLFAIYIDSGKPIFVRTDNPPKEDVQTEYKFTDTTSNAFIANGASETSAFITVRGKVYSVNFITGQLEWEKDLTDDRAIPSLGLIIKGDKLLCFTNNSIHCLGNEK